MSRRVWTIVGVVFHGYTYFNDAGFLPNDVSVYANYADAQRIAGFTGFSSIYARHTDFGTTEREGDRFLATKPEEKDLEKELEIINSLVINETRGFFQRILDSEVQPEDDNG